MSKTISKIIGYALVIVLLVAAVGFAYKYTNGFNEDFKTFYVECDGEKILTTDNKMNFTAGNVYKFDVKYTFDREDAEPKGYKVKIVPNVTRDFDFTVDGEKYLFSKVVNLTDVFDITLSDTSFELYLPDDISCSEVLKRVYNGTSVSISQDAWTNNPYPFNLQISSYNGKVTYNICFELQSKAETPSDSGTVDETPIEKKYSIEYVLSGDATNLSNLTVNGATQAIAGETVSFGITVYDVQYAITSVSISVLNSSEIVEVKKEGGTYSFTMPQGNVYVWVYFEYTPVEDKTYYAIDYDSLGSGSISMLEISCPDRAEAGANVTFTANLKDEYANEYKILRIAVQLGSGEDYIEELEGDGEYIFIMPDEQTLEENDGYVTLMFYIVGIDM